MPRQPDFYCFFYCAGRDGRCRAGTARHWPGSQPARGTMRGSHVGCSTDHLAQGISRSSGSVGVESKAQRLIPVGRPGIDGLRDCQTSPIGSIRRGL